MVASNIMLVDMTFHFGSASDQEFKTHKKSQQLLCYKHVCEPKHVTRALKKNALNA